MAILYYDDKKLFQLNTEKTTYVIGLSPEGYVGHVYYGPLLHGEPDLYPLRMDEPPFTPSVNKREKSSFLDRFPMEYPTGGIGDYRESCLNVRNAQGRMGCEIHFDSYEIFKGKRKMEGLPASFGTEEEVETLEITCKDPILGLVVVLSYSVFEKENVITRSVCVKNEGSETLKVEKIYSACLDMDNEDFEMISLHGSWARERHIQQGALRYGKQLVSSGKGESSHQEHPFVAMVTPGTDQERGEVYAMHFVYSGNFIGQVERCQFDTVRMVMGINPDEFCWNLKAGDEFQAPEVVMVYSAEGLGEMTRSYHAFYRRHMIRSPYNHKKRPILINNWEATYFDFDTDKLLDIAREAKKDGIELSDLGSTYLDEDSQQELFHRYVLGMYAMQERLVQEFPDLLLENCSGGGARFDPGMLYYSPQIWCSDDTDAIERLEIQEGTALIYPLCAMGAHVSVCPNHTVGRVTPFTTRGHVALAGTFGYELDITKLPEEERKLIPEQTAMYHKYHELIRDGEYYRILSYRENHRSDCWAVASEDKNEVLVTYVQVLAQVNMPSRKVRLRGFDPAKKYRLEGTDEVYSGEMLMNAGFRMKDFWGDFVSRLYHFIAVD